MWLVLLILLILLIAGLPSWPYNRGLGVGYYPSGGIGLLLVVLLVLLLLGVIPHGF